MESEVRGTDLKYAEKVNVTCSVPSHEVPPISHLVPSITNSSYFGRASVLTWWVGLAKEVPATRASTRITRSTRGEDDESSLSPPPPDLQSRLSSPSSDDIPPPRLSLSHDPLAPITTRSLHRTPPSATRSAAEGDTSLASIEAARRAPFTRLSDRLSFGAGDDDVDDTMMNILAQRVDPAPFADDDDDMFDMPPMGMGECGPPELHGD